MTYEVPSVSDATDEAGGAFSSMLEGAAAGAGIEIGKATVPVLGPALGGFAASLALSREGAKTYTNRRAAEEAMGQLLE